MVNAKNIGAVKSFEGKKVGGQFQTKSQIGVVTCVCFHSINFFMKYMIFIT